MIFSHRDDPALTATLCQDQVSEESATIVMERLLPTGKTQKKSFKKKSKWAGMALLDAELAALRFLLQEGYVDAQGRAWVADTGALRCVEPGSCAVTEHAIGAGVMPRAIACVPGAVLAVLDVEEGAEANPGTPPFRAPARGRSWNAVVRLEAAGLRELHRVEWKAEARAFDRLSVAVDGCFAGPHADGVGIFAPDGKLLSSHACAGTKHTAPRAALSPNGRLLATTLGEDRGLRVLDLQTGAESELAGAFSQVHRLELDDAGQALVGGFQYPSWGLYRLRAGEEPARLSANLEATLSPDGTRLVELERNRVTVRALESGAQLASGSIPWLGMAKVGRARFVGEDEVIVRTDAHTLAGVGLGAL